MATASNRPFKSPIRSFNRVRASSGTSNPGPFRSVTRPSPSAIFTLMRFCPGMRTKWSARMSDENRRSKGAALMSPSSPDTVTVWPRRDSTRPRLMPLPAASRRVDRERFTLPSRIESVSAFRSSAGFRVMVSTRAITVSPGRRALRLRWPCPAPVSPVHGRVRG